jgi:LPS-assembly protein
MLHACTFLGLAVVLGTVTVARAQAPLTLGEGDIPVSVVADQIESIGPDLVTATGNVEITRGAGRLLADRVEINRSTGDAVATGRVLFYDGEDRLSSSRIEYNLRTGTGVAFDAEGFSLPYYRLSGERIQSLGDSVYEIRKGVFTTCEDDPPTWSFHAGSARADLDDHVYGRNGSFRVKDVPLLPVPYFAAALRRERQTGFLLPTLGTSSRKGFTAKVPFFWAISDSQDLTVSLDAYSKLGLGMHAEYRYILSSRSQGALSGFFVQEFLEDDDTRGIFRVRHTWAIDPTLTLRVDGHHVSDDRVVREYGDFLHERSLQWVESNVFLTKRWATWNFVASAFWYEDLTTPAATELQRLPDLRLNAYTQPLPGVPGALWSLDTRFTNFVRDVGSSGARLDIAPRISRPFSPLGLFTVTPFVGGRATTYTKEVTGLETLPPPRNLVVEETRETLRTRLLGVAGATLEARATRVFDVDLGHISRLAHLVEPRAQYWFVDGTNTDRIPQWDEVDGADRVFLRELGLVEPESRTNALYYSLTNRLLAKRSGADPGAPSARWELLRFTVGNSYDLDAGQRPVGPIMSELIVDPGAYLRLRADAAFSVYESAPLRRANADVSLVLPVVTAAVGGRYDEDARIEFIQGGATARVSRYLSVRGSTAWDVRRDAFVESRIGADIRFQCWSVALTYVDRYRGEDEFRVTVDLLGIGSVGTGTGLP